MPPPPHRLVGALPLAAAGGVLALGVHNLGGLPVAILLLIPVLGLGGLCRVCKPGAHEMRLQMQPEGTPAAARQVFRGSDGRHSAAMHTSFAPRPSD